MPWIEVIAWQRAYEDASKDLAIARQRLAELEAQGERNPDYIARPAKTGVRPSSIRGTMAGPNPFTSRRSPSARLCSGRITSTTPAAWTVWHRCTRPWVTMPVPSHSSAKPWRSRRQTLGTQGIPSTPKT